MFAHPSPRKSHTTAVLQKPLTYKWAWGNAYNLFPGLPSPPMTQWLPAPLGCSAQTLNSTYYQAPPEDRQARFLALSTTPTLGSQYPATMQSALSTDRFNNHLLSNRCKAPHFDGDELSSK